MAQTFAVSNVRNVSNLAISETVYQRNLPECSIFHVGPILEISWKSVLTFSRYTANRPKKDKNITFAVRWW